MLITSSWVIDLLILLSTVTFLLYKYATRNYDYFKKRNIPYDKPIPFLGSMSPVASMTLTIGEYLRDLYNSIDAPYFGIFVFDEPCIIIKSPELIKQVLVKEFSKFPNRTVLSPTYNEIVSNMPFFARDTSWRKMRTKMSPAFTSGKLKGMFSIINESGAELGQYIQEKIGKIESKELTTRFSTDVIAKCAFAINANSLKDVNTEFMQFSRSLFDFTLRNGFIQVFYFLKPHWAYFLRLEFFEQWIVTRLKDIIWSAVRQKEQSNIKGNDIVDLIVEIRKNKDFRNEFDGDKILSPALQFFAAGTETTSSTMAFTLYELCLNTDIQDKLREEILTGIKEHGGITYDGVQKMKYLEMCILETLRKYPVLPFLDRTCSQDYKIPGTDTIIEKGMPVYIPLMGLHYDEKYFPQPEKYDPERFADKGSLNLNGLYYIPFGEGPRICIGERFGMLEIKTGLANILSQFVVERIPETPVPLIFEQKSLVLQSPVGLPVRFKEPCLTSV